MLRLSFGSYSKLVAHGGLNTVVRNAKRSMGGYIEDSQLSTLGLEIYQEIHGVNKVPSINFVIPSGDDIWPSNLWNYELGKGVEKYLSKYFSTRSSVASPTSTSTSTT